MGMSWQTKYAIGVAAYGALVITVLATRVLPFETVFAWLLVMFVLAFVGGGLFFVVLAHRRRGTTPRGLHRFTLGMAAFYLTIGVLGIVVFAVPSLGGSAFLTIGTLFIARGIAFAVARRVMKRRDTDLSG
jgi:hypothetical protein